MEEIGKYQSSCGEAFLFLFDKDVHKAKAVKLLNIPAGNASVGWPVHKVEAKTENNAREKLISWVESEVPSPPGATAPMPSGGF